MKQLLNLFRILITLFYYFWPALLILSILIWCQNINYPGSFSISVFCRAYLFFTYLGNIKNRISSFLCYFVNNLIFLLQSFTIYYAYFILNHDILLKDRNIFSLYCDFFIIMCSFIAFFV